MSTIPQSREQQINFFETLLPIWLNDPTAIGLTSAMVTNLNGLTVAARASFVSVEAIRSGSKAATTDYYGATDAMRAAGGVAINTIRAFAEGAADPAAVYAAAQIPPPASPSPAPPPDAPTSIVTSVQSTGEVKLTWKVTQSRPGAEFSTIIFRRLNGTGSYIEYSSTSEKSFVDAGIPVGTTSVSYVLRTRRNGQTSAPSATVTQYLGVPGNGEQQSLTLAA